MTSLNTFPPSCPRDGDVYVDSSGLQVYAGGSWQSVDYSTPPSAGIFVGNTYLSESDVVQLLQQSEQLSKHLSKLNRFMEFLEADTRCAFHREYQAWLAIQEINGSDNDRS